MVKSSLHRFALILTVGLAATVLLLLAWPRLQASISFLPVDTAMSNYWKERQIDNQQLDALIERAYESIALHDHYRYWDGLSELLILSSEDLNKPLWQRRLALDQSVLAAEEVLARAPAKPRTWLRIAQLRAFLLYPEDTVVPALRMSILTGRVEPTLMLARLKLGLAYLSDLDQETLFLLRDQLVLTWATQKRPMVKRLRDGSLGIAPLRELLTGYNEDILAEMETHLVQ